MRKYFGTDGIRAVYGEEFFTDAFCGAVGTALGSYLSCGLPEQSGYTVVIGRDTRSSGETIERAVEVALHSMGVNVLRLGVVPTPAVSMTLLSLGADAGVMITASHNPAEYNGLKIFSSDGIKLSEQAEEEFEDLIDKALGGQIGAGPEKGASEDYDGISVYRDIMAHQLVEDGLEGWKIVVDCANGSMTTAAPSVLRSLGADIVTIGCSPNGTNINDGVGSEHPMQLGEVVRREGAVLGIAHDGDGDRLRVVDETGTLVDGDSIICLLARHLQKKEKLPKQSVVVTAMSNMGLDAELETDGIKVERVAVGDRNVIWRMQERELVFGGENSGHLIFRNVSRTGDGLLAALRVLEVLMESGKPLSELACCFRAFPQKTENHEVSKKTPFDAMPEFKRSLAELETLLEGKGRILLRYSGTEPKIRLLVEAQTDELADDCLGKLRALCFSSLAMKRADREAL